MRSGSGDRARRARSCLLCLSIAAALPLVAIGRARAAPLVYEPFAYDAATLLDGVAASGTNLAGPWTPLGPADAQKLVVASPGLGYGSLIGAPSASGNRASDAQGVTAAGGTVSVGTDVLIAPGQTIYWSALFTFDDSENGNHLANIALLDDTNGDEISFGEPAVGVRGVRVAVSTAASGGLVADGADLSFSNGATLFLVGRYTNGAAPDGDSVDLVGYDTAAAIALPAGFDPDDPNAAFAFGLSGLDIDLARISALAFTIRGLDNNFIDELRIGTSYADVVPEPATGALLGLGLSGLALRARARIRHAQPRGGRPRAGFDARSPGPP